MRTTYHFTRGGTINGKTLAPNSVIATLDTPDGLDPARVIAAISSGLAVAAPAVSSVERPAPAPEVLPPKTVLPAVSKAEPPAAAK